MFVVLRPVQVHGGGVPVQRVNGVWVGEQLREERLKDVGEVWFNMRRNRSQRPQSSHRHIHVTRRIMLLIYRTFTANLNKKSVEQFKDIWFCKNIQLEQQQRGSHLKLLK